MQVNSNCVILGDFNATHNTWNCFRNSTRGTQLKDFCDRVNIEIIYPDSPTRYGYNTSNTLDIALVNDFNLPYNITSLTELSSDHNPVLLNFAYSLPIHQENPRAITTCWRLFKKCLNNNIILEEFAKFNNPFALEEKIATFTEAVCSTHLESSQPITDTRHTFTPHTIELIALKNRAPKMYKNYKVRVHNTFSLPHRVNIGVTQGSLLGPVLFNIYLNDIPSHPQTMLNLYADDTAILATYKNHKTVTLDLNKHLALLENYFNQWKIKINVEKTVAVLFTKRIKPVKPPTLYSTPLQWSQSTKYLGLILDKNLTWKHHILHARDKFRHALRLIYP
ncbi:RNA-directed DNA polymerase from mobile element jockey [Trichonephila clavipes]|nr:RNA-directed DNA polymerase from mobile element jockey [Trichonephila clavipes]